MVFDRTCGTDLQSVPQCRSSIRVPLPSTMLRLNRPSLWTFRRLAAEATSLGNEPFTPDRIRSPRDQQARPLVDSRRFVPRVFAGGVADRLARRTSCIQGLRKPSASSHLFAADDDKPGLRRLRIDAQHYSSGTRKLFSSTCSTSTWLVSGTADRLASALSTVDHLAKFTLPIGKSRPMGCRHRCRRFADGELDREYGSAIQLTNQLFHRLPLVDQILRATC